MKKSTVTIVGLGHQAIEDHIPAVNESPYHKLSSVCDVNEEKVNEISKKYNVDGFNSCDNLLASKKPDIAILAIPHNEYLPVIKKFASHGVHIIKEKPFAISIDNAIQIASEIERNNVFLGITLQRRFNPIFTAFNQLRHRIGKIYFIDGIYALNIKNLDNNWRSSYNLAGGGALIDMGYHFIDLLVWYMGIPDTVTARISKGNRENQCYDVEDIANLMFDYSESNYQEKTLGRFLISRVHPTKEEFIVFYGTRGTIRIERGKITRFDTSGNVVDLLERKNGWSSASLDQLIYFTKIIQGKIKDNYSFKEHFKHVAIIHAAYQSDKKRTSLEPIKYYSQFII
jgi:predicted dehydrogenase